LSFDRIGFQNRKRIAKHSTMRTAAWPILEHDAASILARVFVDGDERIDLRAIPVKRVDRWTQQGLNPEQTRRRRIDIGTSLGNLGDGKEAFFRHAAGTHELFAKLFSDRPNPVDAIYRNLARRQ
jgi:hypothetical protein